MSHLKKNIHSFNAINDINLKNLNEKTETSNSHLQNLVNYGGAGNNTTIGDGSVRLQTYLYGNDYAGTMRALKTDTSGRLECSVDALEITADQLNLNTDNLESKLDSLINYGGAGDNDLGDGQVRLQTYIYGHDGSSNQRRVRVDGNGNLQVDVVNQPNIKLEDLSSSLNAQNINGTSRSMATTLKATTNISDVPNNSTFLKCTPQGELAVSGGGRDMELTTSSAKTHATATLTSSDVLTITNQPVNGITILCESNTLGSDFTLNNVKIASSSGGTYYALNSLTHLEESNTGNAKIIHIKNVNCKFLKIELTQSTGVSRDVTYTVTV